MNRLPLITQQPNPIPGKNLVKTMIDRIYGEDRPTVAKDCIFKMEASEEKYGSPLMSHNGRVAYLDAYQDLLDTINYSVQALLEEENWDERDQIVITLDRLFSLAEHIRYRLERKGILDRE